MQPGNGIYLANRENDEAHQSPISGITTIHNKNVNVALCAPLDAMDLVRSYVTDLLETSYFNHHGFRASEE